MITTHYADQDKDYPLFCDFYQPSPEQQAKKAEEQARKKAKVDARKAKEVRDYITKQVQEGNPPQLVLLSGNRLIRTILSSPRICKLALVRRPQRKYTVAHFCVTLA